MQEAELNEALSRMRLQLLKEGHFSQLSGQPQRDSGISQGLGLQQAGQWGPSLQAPSSSTNGWLPDAGGLGQAGVAVSRTLQEQGAGSNAWSAPQMTAAGAPEPAEHAAGVWGGGLFASDPQKIWSGGASISPPQGDSLTAPSLGAGLPALDNGQMQQKQQQRLTPAQHLQFLAAQQRSAGHLDASYSNSMASLDSSMGGHSLSPGYTPVMDQQGVNGGGLFDLGLLNDFNSLGGGADGGGYNPAKLQGALGQQQQHQQLPNGMQDGGLSGLGGADLGMGAGAFGNGVLNSSLAAKLNGLTGGGAYANGLNGGGFPGVLNGVGGSYGNGGQPNGLVNDALLGSAQYNGGGLSGAGLSHAAGLALQQKAAQHAQAQQQQQQAAQQQQQQAAAQQQAAHQQQQQAQQAAHQQQAAQQLALAQLREQLLAGGGLASLPPNLQAYARELLLQQHLLGAPQPPPPPPAFPGQGGANGFLQHGGAGGAHHMPQPPPQPQQQQGLGALRNGGGYLHPFGRAGPRTLPGKGPDEGYLLGAQPDLLNGLAGVQPPPPPTPPPRPGGPPGGARLQQPPPPPPAQLQFSARASVQQKKVLASLLQRGPSRDKAYVPGARPKAEMAVLDAALAELVESLRPTPEEKARQSEALEAVRAALVKRWPDCKVHLFGSTANELSICNNNDIDICLELPDLPNDLNTKGEVVDQLGQLLVEAGMQNVLPLPKARVPVVKFVVGDNGTKVDITVNNILAIVNTKLLADYGRLDKRLLHLAYVIKHWAKRRQVNDSYRGTLSSYCYVLMCIHLLQQRQPPILPCLHSIKPPTLFRTVGQWVCDYCDDVESLAGFGSGNGESLGELVWAFFEYWAWKHDYNNAVVSVRTGGFLTKSQKEWTRRVGNERHLVCIEDPFELTHDLGRTVDRQTNGVLHKEFERAACVLRDHDAPLEKLLEPYRAGKTE